MQHAAPFSNAQDCGKGLFHGATKNYVTDHNTMREQHLHDGRKSYGSESEVIFPFPDEAAGHKNGPMLHRKFMWQDHSNPLSANPLNKLTYRKKVENLLVGKTKSYSTNNTHATSAFVQPSCSCLTNSPTGLSQQAIFASHFS